MAKRTTSELVTDPEILQEVQEQAGAGERPIDGGPRVFADHPRPVTRRDFLASGAIGFMGTVAAPTALGLLFRSNPALAAECGVSEVGRKIAVLHINMEGGMPLAAAFLGGLPTPSSDPRSGL